MATRKGKDTYAQMQRDVAEAPKRNLTGSLDQVKQELQDAYMTFKELSARCVVDINTVNKTDKPVYYFKPDTFLLEDAEGQRFFRESLLKKIAAIPKPEPITYLGDEMHRAYLATVADQSRPTICKKNLAMYYKRRQYALQHLKYKMLCRWAHLAMNSSQMDTGKDAVFLYGKIEYSIEQAMNRSERLEQEDYFDMAIPKNRPNTKAELGEGSLYVENVDLQPQSLLREDDIEIYMRSVSYRNKVSKVVNKFMSRLKWLPLQHRFEIYEDAITAKHNQKEQNIKSQFDFIDKIDARARSMHIMSPDVEAELGDILNSHYVRKHALMYSSQSEKISNSWRSDHDNVPNFVNNQHELKIRILEAAEKYEIKGDIELDHGYSFSYRVTVKFPQYFQRQCIKSQFSIYDVFAKENDKNEVQKHTLVNMTRVDTNIFRDVSTTPNMVPDDDSIAFELRRDEDLKVIRLKSCAYWIDYVCLVPTEADWHKKQQAILNHNNPIDSLTASGMNFLDVNDLASVNRINEDNALLHQQAIKKLQGGPNPHDMVYSRTQNSSNDGERKLAINLQQYVNSTNIEQQMDTHLMHAVQGGGVATEMGNGRTDAFRPSERQATTSRSGLRNTPQHLLVSYFTLRYMKSRDNKTKILYALNFCRAIQKRLALDLREFGTRERIDSHLTQPYVHSTDADKKVVTNVNLCKNPYDGADDKVRASQAAEDSKYEKMTVFDQEMIKNMKNMASVRMYKCNGYFNNKVFSTCPSVPKFHCTFGEPTMRQTEDMEMDAKKTQSGISKNSLKLMGRIDYIELNERTEEVYVKDDFGVYILYDCVLQDMRGMEEELVKICSYYLHKAEVLLDVHTDKPQPGKDRLQILSDLLECEAAFHYKKIKLTMAYLECYEHICDPLEQQRLMQIITDVMSRRPRLNLQANYFTDSYQAECDCLDNQFELVKFLVKTQMDLEKTNNKMLQDSLSLSYTLCNQYEQNKFKYQDAEELLQAVMNREKSNTNAKKYAQTMNQLKKRQTKDQQTIQKIIVEVREEDHNAENSETGSATSKQMKNSAGGSSKNADVKTKGDDGSKSDVDDASSLNSADMQNLGEDNAFQQLLGLPEISIETLYMQYKEKDKTIIKLMNEHTNFIQIHEGYPEFLNFQQGGTNGANMRKFKVCPWSEPSANLDFYDSLQFINKFYGIVAQVQQELYDTLKPYDPTVMTYIDSQVAVKALAEFRRVIKIQEGAEVEYEGRQYVEDESVMGSPDKMVFYAKEMIADLTMGPKTTIDPYLIAKLNVNTINFFEFPRMPKESCKYKMQYQDGVKPADWVIVKHKQALVDAAQRKSGDKAVNIEHVIATSQIQLSSTRNIDVPTQLQTYCNIVELMRLRHEIILTASECSVLQQIYLHQGKLCKIASLDIWLQDSVSFENVDIHDDQEGLVNFFEDGTSYNIDIGLAVKEYDPSLLANFNFRNPDSVKLNITDAGLEEVRSVLMYQLLQKHLLIVATRANQSMIDSSMKAITELELLQKLSISLPNSTFDIHSVFSRNADSLSSSMMREAKLKFGQNMSNSIANVFYSITMKKSQLRTNISKEFSNYMSKVSRVHQVKNQCVQRVMRSFKVKQLVRYCEHIILEAHLDAQKVQALQVCQRLRTFSHYFSFDPALFNMTVIQKGKPGEPRKEDYQIFEYETNSLIENFTYPYMPKVEEEAQFDTKNQASKDIHAINPLNMSILSLSAIPSSAKLMQCESSSLEELRTFRQRLHEIHRNYNENYQDDLSKLDATTGEPEKQSKQMLPAFTPRDLDPSQGKGKPEEEIDKVGYPILDYEEALNFGQSQFSQMLRYYQYLERILNLEWFICKLQFRQDTVVHMDNAFNLGLPFWIDTDYEKRMKKEVKTRPVKEGINPISQNFLHSNIVSRQKKKYIAEELSGMSLTMQNLLRTYKSTKDELKYEYLNSYTEFRYLQILGSFHKINQQFYIQKRSGLGIRSLRSAISSLTKMDHVKISFSKGNSFHVNTSLVHPQMQLLESTNLIYGAHSEDECQNFRRCVQPVLNEKSLEPAQLTLFQSLYQTDSFRKRMPTQFGGQMVSTHNTWSFKALDTALLDMCQEDRSYTQSFIVQAKYQANDFMEIVKEKDESLASMGQDDVYDLFQLTDAKKFLSDGTQSLLLKNALICWNENQVLPDDPNVYAKFEENFRNNFFWKIIEHKENMVQNLATQRDSMGAIPSKKHLDVLRNNIDQLQNDYSLATTSEEEHRAKMIELLQEEFRAQKKKVTLDSFYSTKAEIMVLSNEIEKHITAASVRTLDGETAALTRCLALSQPKIQYHIHPFQQFAATSYDKVDPQKHLDMAEKLEAIQEFLTKLVNRGTEVETLTSGPGIVFTKKDFNEAIQTFCRRIITYGEQALQTKLDSQFQIQEQYKHQIYVKDQRITDMERRIASTAKNIENTISAKLFEKGNQLIYQLDSTSRLLTLFKQNMYNLEEEVKTKILGEQAQKFKLQKDALDTQVEKLNDYKQHVSQIVSARFAADYDKICADLKKAVDQAKVIDPEMSQYVNPKLYPATGNSKYRQPVNSIVIGGNRGGVQNGAGADAGFGGNPSGGTVISNLATAHVGTLPGSIIPDGFTHYSHCSCFQPSKRYPNYSLEHAEIEMYSEQEARFELARVCEVMRKQRLFWRTKEMLSKQKYQNQINLMKKQLSNNAYLWDQMAECEKRETILKQELLFTQQSLSSAEKVIEKLQEEMKKVEADRQRLYKYKHSKAERLKELEDKIKKFEVYENIDTDKLINVLGKKDEECKKLQGIAENFSDQINLAEHRKDKEVGHFKGKLVQEQVKTQQIVEKMEQMKLELKMLESNDTSVAAIWKKKCLDLFEVCQTLKNENEELRDRCKELIVQGIQLADAVNQESNEQNQILQQNPSPSVGQGFPFFPNQKPLGPTNTSLPKLQSAGSVHRATNQQTYISGKPTPATAGVTSGRQGSSTAGTFDYASANGGYNVDSRLQGGVQSVQGEPNIAMMQSNFSAGGDDVKSMDRHFASTMNATAKHNSFYAGNNNQGGKKMALRSPQVQQTAPFPRQQVGAGQRRQGAPQTHQTKRGRTGPAGPVYYMPGSSTQEPAAQHVLRPGKNTRQKPRQQLTSLMSNDHKDDLAASSFNQSFHVDNVSTDKYGRSQMNSNQANRNQHDTSYGAIANTAQRQAHGLNFGGMQQPHNDSLFESSKASTNNQTSIIRRQFNKNNPVRPYNANVRATEQMMGAAVFGAKINAGPPQQSTTTAFKGQHLSTKPGSQLSEINSKAGTKMTSLGVAALADGMKLQEESILGEASFAPQMPSGSQSALKEQIQLGEHDNANKD